MAMVDAHTEEVHFGYSSTIHLGMLDKIQGKNLKLIVINGKPTYPYSQGLLVNGRVYVPVKWLSGFGIKWDGTKLVGRYKV